MSYTLSVDVGGTFTDAFLSDGSRLAKGKARTTGHDLSVGFLAAVRDAAQSIGIDPDVIFELADHVMYSTTVGTNALIERVGPSVGLITTRGQEETMHLGRSRSWADGMSHEVQMDRTRAHRPPDLVPRPLRVGVRERIDCFGNVVMPLRPDDVLERVDELIERGAQAIAVCLTWSFMNPAHEQLVRDVVRANYPDAYLGRTPVLLSSEVAPKLDEYRRTVTTVLAAFLATATEDHVLDVIDRIHELGYSHPLLLARNIGGVSSPSRTTALHLVGAGAIAGVSGAAVLARRYGLDNVVTADMGGTTFDVGLVIGGEERTYEFDPMVDRWRIHLPVLANFTIGAGGGSIAWVSSEGELRVGPRSSGSVPGPACYDTGGTDPTVTDADLVLGYIDPTYFLGGRFPLAPERAERAIRRKVAEPLEIDVLEAARRIRRLVDGTMGQEIHKQTALKGFDPREFSMLAFGGAGPVHACDVAGYADITDVLTFTFGSEFNAFGAASMDIVQSYERSHRVLLFDPVTAEWFEEIEQFNAIVDELLVFARRDLGEEGFALHEIRFTLELDMSYAGQQHTVRHTHGGLYLETARSVRELADAFGRTFANVYGEGATHPEGGIEIQLFKVTASASLPKPTLEPELNRHEREALVPKGSRPCDWRGIGMMTTPVFDRQAVRQGDVITGPALLEDVDTVVAVAPGWTCEIDEILAARLRKETG